MGLFQVEALGDASTRIQDTAGCILHLPAEHNLSPALGCGAPAPEREPGQGGPLQAPSSPRRSPSGTAAPRPERAGSVSARPHPVDPPGSQPDDGRSERTPAEIGPGILTPDAATGRPPGKGEVVRSSPGDRPHGPPAPPGGGSAAPAPPRAQRHRGGGSARFSQDLVHPPAGQSHHALRELENKKGCTP